MRRSILVLLLMVGLVGTFMYTAVPGITVADGPFPHVADGPFPHVADGPFPHVG